MEGHDDDPESRIDRAADIEIPGLISTEEDKECAVFTREERARIRRILRDDDRARWFWASLRIWGAYIGAAIVGIYTLQDPIMRMFKWLAR
jgi:hypothetical protein